MIYDKSHLKYPHSGTCFLRLSMVYGTKSVYAERPELWPQKMPRLRTVDTAISILQLKVKYRGLYVLMTPG